MPSLSLHSLQPFLPTPTTPRAKLTTPFRCTVASALPSNPSTKAQNKKKKKQDDDYHATLKALNSKSRFPRKSLGQHYMLNEAVNEELVSTAGVEEGDVVLEIGPGTGSLTNVLVNAGATVLAIEKDPYMAAIVEDRFAGTNLVKVLREDFTRCHIRSHMSSILIDRCNEETKFRHAKVVANIPFNISTDVVKQLLPMGDIFSEVVLLLQDETAQRLVDPALRSSEYRPINIFVRFYSDPEYKLKVPRENFFPQPKVDAAVVAFRLKQAVDYPQVSSTKSFFSMVNCAFNEKRKMLRKSLQHFCPSTEIEAALGEVGFPATSRPEELVLEDFVRHITSSKREKLGQIPGQNGDMSNEKISPEVNLLEELTLMKESTLINHAWWPGCRI